MDFKVLEDTFPEDRTLPAFMVSTTRGFLPRTNPPVSLPKEFEALEKLLQEMPIRKASGEPGLLANHKLGEFVENSFPNLVEEVEKFRDDQITLNALYRDYSFLLSAYLFEPCYETYLRTEGTGYGLGRSLLPKNVAQPIARVGELTRFQPFMEYAGSYALYNYRLLDESRGMEYDNLALIRAFEYGLDNKSSEAGFVLIHVAMVQHSNGLVSGVKKALDALRAANTEATAAENRELFNDGLREILGSMRKINTVMEDMWKKSKPESYSSFRVFIFGIHSQPMFPNGVIYEGVSEEPMRFRGESGANDSMVPLIDNFMCVDMPDNPLTDILKDFREYRPGNHKDFLKWVYGAARGDENQPSVKEFALRDPKSAVLYLFILDQLRDFRGRHWNFTREYILKQGKRLHPKATGGSPIVEWLPNQLFQILDLMASTNTHITNMGTDGNIGPRDAAELEGIMESVARQRKNLEKEVSRYSESLKESERAGLPVQ
ncbi:Myoglobin [Dactylella cylindrospora]|nr:Myoglobin [Dactylella cylindrospora]